MSSQTSCFAFVLRKQRLHHNLNFSFIILWVSPPYSNALAATFRWTRISHSSHFKGNASCRYKPIYWQCSIHHIFWLIVYQTRNNRRAQTELPLHAKCLRSCRECQNWPKYISQNFASSSYDAQVRGRDLSVNFARHLHFGKCEVLSIKSNHNPNAMYNHTWVASLWKLMKEQKKKWSGFCAG